MFDYLLFDLDGTLTDPKEGITKSIAYALERFGIYEEPDNLTHFIGPPLYDSFERFYGFSHEKALTAVEYYRERFAPIGVFENKVLDGIPQMLADLKESGSVLAVASSKPEVFVEKILDKFELKQYFSAAVGSTLDSTMIDKADVIKEALFRLGVSSEQKHNVIMVGDRKHDIIGAKMNGIQSVGVKYGYAKEGELENAKPNFICQTVSDLQKVLKS